MQKNTEFQDQPNISSFRKILTKQSQRYAHLLSTITGKDRPKVWKSSHFVRYILAHWYRKQNAKIFLEVEIRQENWKIRRNADYYHV